MRNSFYCLYNGKEYRVGNYSNGLVHLTTRDLLESENGFEPYHLDEKLLVKKIPWSSIGKYYRVYATAIYCGEEFHIACVSDNQIAIVTSNPQVAHDHSMNRTDKCEYKKWVGINEVEIIETEKEYEIPST